MEKRKGIKSIRLVIEFVGHVGLNDKDAMLLNAFVIIWGGYPIAVSDEGYPYKTEYPGSVRYWETEEEAKRYIDLFRNSPSYSFYGHAIVREVQFRLVD